MGRVCQVSRWSVAHLGQEASLQDQQQALQGQHRDVGGVPDEGRDAARCPRGYSSPVQTLQQAKRLCKHEITPRVPDTSQHPGASYSVSQGYLHGFRMDAGRRETGAGKV